MPVILRIRLDSFVPGENLVGAVAGRRRPLKKPIKGDLSGHCATRGGLKVNLRILSIGPQTSYRMNDKVVPFVHVLLGGGRAIAGFGDLNFSNAAFAMNIGGGLDWIAHKRCAIHATQLDLLVTRFGPDTSTAYGQNTQATCNCFKAFWSGDGFH